MRGIASVFNSRGAAFVTTVTDMICLGCQIAGFTKFPAHLYIDDVTHTLFISIHPRTRLN